MPYCQWTRSPLRTCRAARARLIYQDVDADVAYQQGDILQRHAGANVGRPSLLCIITADCDLAQDKYGDRITCLEVLPASDYLQEVWSAHESKRVFDRALEKALSALNKALEEKGLGQLTPGELVTWVEASSPENIVSAAGINNSSAAEARAALECVGVYQKTCATKPRTRLRKLWDAIGWNDKQRNVAIGNVLNTRFSPGDIFFLPGPPRLKALGLVVRLRNFHAVSAEELHTSEWNARLSDMETTYYRVARLSDGVRFSLIQKMAHLFSRIGLTDDFETEAELEARMAADEFRQIISERI